MPDERLEAGQLWIDFVQIGAVVRGLDQSIKVLSDVFGIPVTTSTSPRWLRVSD